MQPSAEHIAVDSTARVNTRVLQALDRFTEPSGSVYVGQQMAIFIAASPPEAAR